MDSDTSADDPVFADCVTPSTRPAATSDRQERRASVPEMFRRAEGRKAKRPAPDRGSKSPCDPAQLAAKRPPAPAAGGPAETAEPAEPPAMGLSTGALAAIRQLVDNGIAAVINAFDAKFTRMEKRIELLESEAMKSDGELNPRPAGGADSAPPPPSRIFAIT